MNGNEKTAREFGRILASDEGPPSLSERLTLQRQALIEMTVARSGQYRQFGRRRNALRVAAVLSAAAASLILYFSFSPTRDQPIPFFVGESGIQEREGRFLSTAFGERTVIRFDGGSLFEFEEATEARVVKASGKEVTIDLTQGKVYASVNPSSKRIWTVRAGPYEVVVKGTVFAVDWDNTSAVLSVSVTRGRVAVKGPGLDSEGVPLAAGNTLKADAHVGRITFARNDLTEEAAVAKIADTEDALERVKNAKDVEDAIVPRARSKASLRTSSHVKVKPPLEVCRQLYRSKDYTGVVAHAEKHGLINNSKKLSKDDLWMFANAARYSRRTPLANELFSLYRARFSQTPRARTAAFLLGKSAMRSGSPAKASRWFSLYLAETPNGPLAEEALGHLIDIHSSMGHSNQARQFARDYLSKYNGGYFSKQAHQVLSD